MKDARAKPDDRAESEVDENSTLDHIREFLRGLNDPVPDIRASAIQGICHTQMTADIAIWLLRAGLEDSAVEIREQAVRELVYLLHSLKRPSDIEPNVVGALRALSRLVDDESPSIRRIVHACLDDWAEWHTKLTLTTLEDLAKRGFHFQTDSPSSGICHEFREDGTFVVWGRIASKSVREAVQWLLTEASEELAAAYSSEGLTTGELSGTLGQLVTRTSSSIGEQPQEDAASEVAAESKTIETADCAFVAIEARALSEKLFSAEIRDQAHQEDEIVESRMNASVPWKTLAWWAGEQAALRFSTESGLDTACRLFWTEGHPLYRIPREYAGDLTLVVPQEAVGLLREAGVTFTETRVVPSEEVPLDRLNRLRRQQGTF